MIAHAIQLAISQTGDAPDNKVYFESRKGDIMRIVGTDRQRLVAVDLHLPGSYTGMTAGVTVMELADLGVIDNLVVMGADLLVTTADEFVVLPGSLDIPNYAGVLDDPPDAEYSCQVDFQAVFKLFDGFKWFTDEKATVAVESGPYEPLYIRPRIRPDLPQVVGITAVLMYKN